MATYKLYAEEKEEKEQQKKERIEAAREKLRVDKLKRTEYDELEDDDELEKQAISEELLGFAILVGFGIMVLYRYLTYGFI